MDEGVDEVGVFSSLEKGDLKSDDDLDQIVLNVDPSLCTIDAAVVCQDVE